MERGLAPSLMVGGLQRFRSLSDQKRRQLGQVFNGVVNVGPGGAIRREGEAPGQVSVLISGCACSYKTLVSGRRQIVGFYFPGEFCDLPSLFLNDIGYGVNALSRCTVATGQRSGLCRLLEVDPAIGSALWRLSLLDAAILREWMVGMGRRSAQAQVAHLLCEVMMRSRTAGVARGDTCALPLTQADMADALGLSSVQINKELQTLRAAHLISLQRGLLSILDFERLAACGQFSPGYLQIP